MAGLRAEEGVGSGGDRVDGEFHRVAGGDELTRGDRFAGRVPDRHVVLRRARVHEPEADVPAGGADRAKVPEPEDDVPAGVRDRRGVELELCHRHLDRPRGLRVAAAPAAAAAGGEQRDGHKSGCEASHLNAVTPRYRMPKRKNPTTSTKCQYRVTAAGPTWLRELN